MKKASFFWLLLLLPFLVSAQDTLSLEQCTRLALERNQKVRMAKENQSAMTSIRKAAFTQFLPDFSFTGSYTHMDKKLGLLSENMFLPVVPYSAIGQDGSLNTAALGPNDIVINPVTHQPVLDANGNPVFQKYTYLPKDKATLDLTNMFLFDIGVVQPIFTGGKIYNIYKSAKIAEQIAGSAEVMETQDLIYKVQESYWRMISLREKVRLATEYRNMISRLIYDLDNLNKEGIIITNDLLKARVKENEAELDLMKAQNGLDLSIMALNQLVGTPLDSKPVLTDSVMSSPLALENKDFSKTAMLNRPEIRILKNTVELAGAGVNIEKSRFLPQIGFTANYLYSDPNPYNGFKKEFGSDWNIGVVCTIPIFHWGERYHTLSAAKHEKKATELKLSETEEMVSLQTRQAVLKFNESLKKVELTSRSLSQAEENLRVTQDNFHEGILKSTDVLEAQTLWQKAFSENIDARIDARVSDTYLKKVTGELTR